MSLWRIAWRSIQQRGVASLLTMLSMALGVMMVVAILSIHGVVDRSFKANSQLGYNMIIGATKGGKLQVTLNSVFYLSSPVENIPYDYYLQFLPAEQRDAAYDLSIQKAVHDATWESLETAAQTSGDGLIGAILQEATEQAAIASAETGDYTPCVQPLIQQPVLPWHDGETTRFGPMTATAIPLCLGDYLGQFRVVGTVPEFFEKLTFGEDADQKYVFASGRNMRSHDEENGYFESVLGAAVARAMNLKVGDTFSSTHGASDGKKHDEQGFKVVGILEFTGTPNDRAAFVNMEGFYLLENHAKPLGGQQLADESGQEDSGHDHDHEHELQPLPLEQREVTAVLVRTIGPAVAIQMQNLIDEQEDTAQVVLPVLEIYRLFDVFVNPIQRLLIVLTGMICVVSGISILVSIYNSMSERTQEIAVMRALGARRGTVMSIILLESVMLALGGGGLGWLAGHGLNWLASSRIEEMTGVTIGFFDLAPPLTFGQGSAGISLGVSSEILLIPALLALAVVVGIFPALTAYRTDVARSLGK